MTTFPFTCVHLPRSIETKRTPLTGGQWLEEGTTAEFAVWVTNQNEYDTIWKFLERTHGNGEEFLYTTDLRNGDGEQTYKWKILSLEPYEDNGAYTEVKFKAQVTATTTEIPVYCDDGQPVLCGGEQVVDISNQTTYPRRR